MYGREFSLISFKFTDVCVCDICKLNDIGDYLRIISECDIMCLLEFWKKWQNHFSGLAKIAKNIKVFKTALLLANVCLAQHEISSP